MPHLTLEYTANIGEELVTPELFSHLHAVLAELAGIELSGCKSRAVRLDRFYLGDGSTPVAFAHLEVGIFAGRPGELKTAIAKRCLAALEEHLAPAACGLDLQITVEVRDMERSAYAKALVRPA
jgi:5-carboxymethyl-2-hydroxymuconate isomerase